MSRSELSAVVGTTVDAFVDDVSSCSVGAVGAGSRACTVFSSLATGVMA